MSVVFDASNRLYKLVDSSSTETMDYVPASGQELFIVNMGLSSSTSPDTVGCIVWDADGTPEILMSSYHESLQQEVGITLVGDGIKILRIHLSNDLTEPAYLGGFWQGQIL